MNYTVKCMGFVCKVRCVDDCEPNPFGLNWIYIRNHINKNLNIFKLDGVDLNVSQTKSLIHSMKSKMTVLNNIYPLF